MPMVKKGGGVRRGELPDTIKRSPAKAQRTFAKAHDAAVDEYGEGERAHRTAYAALKRTFEKWVTTGSRSGLPGRAIRGRSSRPCRSAVASERRSAASTQKVTRARSCTSGRGVSASRVARA